MVNLQDSKPEEGRRVISVFGSARPLPGSSPYKVAYAVGKLLAEAGFAVATGGYEGTMAAVSDGAAGAGGHVIGVGSNEIEKFRPGGLNEWVVEAINYETLHDRLYHLVVKNDGMIALPGGVGTLNEVALAWGFLQIGAVQPRPLVLLGDIWRETMTAFIRSEYIADDHVAMLKFADTAEEAVAIIRETHSGKGV